MSRINTLGPVGFNPTGEYDNTKQYEKLDVVYYQGSSYVATTDSIGQLPTNGDYWDCIAKGGIALTYDSYMKALNIAIQGTIIYNVGKKSLNFETV